MSNEQDELTRLKRQREAALAIHQPIEAVNYGYSPQRLTRVCSGCGTDAGNWQIWPCPTVRALEGGA